LTVEPAFFTIGNDDRRSMQWTADTDHRAHFCVVSSYCM
jgi:hypothetical protein